MRNRRLNKVLAVMLAIIVAFAYTGFNIQVKANDEGETIISEDGGQGSEEDFGADGMGGTKDGHAPVDGGESDEPVNPGEGNNPEEGDEQVGGSNTDDENDPADDNNQDNGNDPDEEDNPPEESEPNDGGISDDGGVSDKGVTQVVLFDGLFEVQLLRELLYDIETSFDSEHIEWVLDAFGHDKEFIVAVYNNIIEEPYFATEFLQGMWDFRNELLPEFNDAYPESVWEESIMSLLMEDMGLFSTGALANIDPNSSTVVIKPDDDCVKSFSKTVTKKDLFRHYDITFNIDAQEKTTEVHTGVDIVYLIDSSRYTDKSTLKSVVTDATQIIGKDTVKAEPDTFSIGIVEYNNNANRHLELTQGWGTMNSAMNSRFSGMSPGTNNESNLQAAIQTAVNMLDNSPNIGRKKVIMLFSNTMPSYRSSDRWVQVGSSYSITKESKRWSYMSGLDYFVGNEMVNVIRLLTLTSGQKEVANIQAALLEAQYEVSRGIEFYALDYSNDQFTSKYFEELTYKMNNPPASFWDDNEGINHVVGIDGATPPDKVRNFQGGTINKELAQQIADQVFEIVTVPAAFTVTDVLKDEFEVLTPLPNGVTVDGQIITWTAGVDRDNKEASVTIPVRVKDKPYFKMGAGIPGSTQRAFVNDSTVLRGVFGGGTLEYKLEEQPDTWVESLIDGTAEVNPEAILSGETAELTGEILRGNGEYAYQWYTDNVEAGKEIQNMSGVFQNSDSGNDISIAIPQPGSGPYYAPYTGEGSFGYVLSLTDNVAVAAGYKNPEVTRADIMCTLKVFDPVLRITVQADPNGVPVTEGMFETRVRSDNEMQSQWYFMGLANKTYRFSDGITRGSYEAETYVPYGYEVSKAEPVTIALYVDDSSQTGYSGYEQEITINVSKTDPYFFFDWAWPGKNNKPLKNEAPAAILAAYVPYIAGRWFR